MERTIVEDTRLIFLVAVGVERHRPALFIAKIAETTEGFDHGVGHPLLLLYDAKAPLGKNGNYFNGLGHDRSNPSIRFFYIIVKYPIFITI